MFDDLYTQLTSRIPYKTLIFVPVALALLMLLLIPNLPLGIEFSGGTSIDVTINKDVSDEEIENLESELSAKGLEDVNIYLKKTIGSDKRTLTVETTTQVESEKEEDLIKIIEKYSGRLNKYDSAEAKLSEKPSKDQVSTLSQRLGISSDDIKYDENENLLKITALELEEDELQSALNYYFESNIAVDVYKGNLVINPISPTLGETFRTQGMKALLIAYILMAFVIFVAFSSDISFEAVALSIGYTALVIILISMNLINNLFAVAGAIVIYLILMIVFIVYKFAVPASAVIAAATCDVIIALGGMSIFGIELKPASLAALLMLIGYSVDSDILLTSRTLKRKVGTINERIDNAMKTGLTMTGTTLMALLTLLIISSMFTQIEILANITSVLLIGLIGDTMTTWFMNAGILKWYLEQPKRKKKKFKFGFSIFSR